MKKGLVITLLITTMLFMVGFTTPEQSYWDQMKAMYEWDAMAGETEIEASVNIPGQLKATYKITMYSQTDLEAFVSYVEMDIEVLETKEAAEITHSIPTVKMFTKGSDIYIHRDLVVYLLSFMESELDFEIEEEYLMIKSGQNSMQMDLTNITDIIDFIEDMDLGIDLGMTQEGNTYSLTIDSDKLIDLLDAYMRHIITNMDQLTNTFMPADASEEMMLTEEQQAEMLEMYEMNIAPMKEMAKGMIQGSYYRQVTTFNKDSYTEEAELFLTTPMGHIHLDMNSNGERLASPTIELPTSVMIITEDELTNLMLGGFGVNQNMPQGVQLRAILDLEGNYIKIAQDTVVEGTSNIQVEDGRVFMAVEDLRDLLDIELEGQEGFLWIGDMQLFGYQIEWNAQTSTVEIYQ